jgi:hypothetical protein
MRTAKFYKLSRPDGWDFKTGKTINYRENIGKIVYCPNQEDTPELCSNSVIHASRKPNQAFIGAAIPCSVYRVEGRPVVEEGSAQTLEGKCGFKQLLVLEEIQQENLDELFGWKYSEACNPVNPLKLVAPEIGNAQIQLLQYWDSVWASVGASVWASVGASVWASVGDSVRDSVGASVRASVWASVGDSVGASVWASVRASVWAYIGLCFPKIKTWRYAPKNIKGYPYQPCVDLWRQGIIPSYDGTTWRLHTHLDARISFKISKEKLREWKP